MFENLTYLTLQHYWWAVVASSWRYPRFYVFCAGVGQTLIYTLGKTDTQKKIVVNALGRKWDLTFYYSGNIWRSSICLISSILFY